MYASLTSVSINPEKSAEATRIWQEEILPITRSFSGWMGAELFTNPQTGEGVAVNFYETETSVHAIEASGQYQQLMSKLAPLMTAPPIRKVFEVAGRAEIQMS